MYFTFQYLIHNEGAPNATSTVCVSVSMDHLKLGSLSMFTNDEANCSEEDLDMYFNF